VKRRLFNLAAALSLMLCLAALGLWTRSHFRVDDISHTGRWHVHNFVSIRGRLVVQWGWSTEDVLRTAAPRYRSGGFFWDTSSAETVLGIEPTPHGWALGGFDCFAWSTSRKNAAGQAAAGERVYIVPWWFVTAVTAVGPTWWFFRIRRQARRTRLGLCGCCGYDLRASAGRCPECGTQAKPQAEPQPAEGAAT
jgi:hypothetical protein